MYYSYILRDHESYDAVQNERLLQYRGEDSYNIHQKINARPKISVFLKTGENNEKLPLLLIKEDTIFLSWFRRKDDNGDPYSTYEVFTSLPYEELRAFDNKFFRSSDNLRGFRIQIPEISDDAYRMYEQRLFTISEVHPKALVQNETKLLSVQYNDFDESAFHPCYVSPVKIRKDDNDTVGAISNFFITGQLPFALPAATTDTISKKQTSYFSQVNTRIRSSFHKKIINAVTLAGDNIAPQSLLFTLMKLIEKGVYREYLWEGAFWSIPAQEGNTQLTFHYTDCARVHSLQDWRNKLLVSNEKDTPAVKKIKDAMLGDIRKDSTGKEICKVKNSPTRISEPFPVLRSFARGDKYNLPHGVIAWIRDFSAGLEQQDRTVIEATLSDYQNQDHTQYDDINARYAFFECFFKCPFPRYEKAWDEVMMHFIIKKGGAYTLRDVLEKYAIQYCNATADEMNIKADDANSIFKLRLLLPPGANISLISSNHLNLENSLLDNNFILG